MYKHLNMLNAAEYVSTAKALGVYCSNLGTITGYKGLTPMINSYVVNSTMGIDDKRNYPLYRTYSLGLSVQF